MSSSIVDMHQAIWMVFDVSFDVPFLIPMQIILLWMVHPDQGFKYLFYVCFSNLLNQDDTVKLVVNQPIQSGTIK